MQHCIPEACLASTLKCPSSRATPILQEEPHLAGTDLSGLLCIQD
eukprot:CAMPEP_0202896022 /NCGR_PEP_ID=MMETSP1392-20130828/5112_1 /ASSEMBLY_ACC=CAM_ASM_000868 /TAXON_ID=225041 /ORGANISM="Chlamydomonas chlamydogama, Strain SAG 11-48b" /LENGTH=44 /DNA_ID= /DNA_START= /DNA_END= /DNA_ORIENTATION=